MMPREVKPRWGETGVMKVPIFRLDEEQLVEIGQHLGIGRSAAFVLKPTLEWIGARYLLWIQQDEKGPSRAEQNAALHKLLASGRELSSTLAQLDYATHARLLDVLWTHPPTESRRVFEQLHQMAAAVDHVVDCVTLALAKGQKGGPGPRKTLPIIIGLLASVYEEATGLEFTHTPYVKTEYKGIPQSHAGRFVTAFLKNVDPDLATTAIATEMARFVKSRKSSG
jgi:hypothetical protein